MEKCPRDRQSRVPYVISTERKMGLIKSKLRNPDNRKIPDRKKIITPNQQVNDYEDHELQNLKRTIVRAPERFILNNLMMCIQFFENFEE